MGLGMRKGWDVLLIPLRLLRAVLVTFRFISLEGLLFRSGES